MSRAYEVLMMVNEGGKMDIVNHIMNLEESRDAYVKEHNELERAKAENARLRADCNEWYRVAKNKQDIIDHMRDALAENAKLREECNHWYVEQVHAYANWEDAYGRASELEAENDKLRELVLKNWYIALSEREALRAHDIDPDGGTYMAALDDEIATAKDLMRELGIEADS